MAGDFDTRVQTPSTATPTTSSRLPPVPDVTLSRPSLLGPAEGSATLDGFAFGKFELTPAHRKHLAALATPLKRLMSEPPSGHIEATGHTDKVGAEKGNETLGQQRADAVRDELVSLGIAFTDIRTHSLGESVPVVDTPSPEPRNRRVEVYFQPNSGRSFPSIMSGGLKRPEPLPATPPPKLPGFDTRIDYCKVFPEECDPNRLPPDLFKPLPEPPKHNLPSPADAVWGPIDTALERGLRKLGLNETWNKRFRDLAKAGVEKGVSEALDKTLDAAHLTGDTRKAVEAAVRAASQQQIPLP